MNASWQSAPLGELVSVVRNPVDPTTADPSLTFVGLEHIESETGAVVGVPLGTTGIRSSKFSFIAGDILFGKLRPYLRKAGVSTCEGICSTDIVPLRPVDKSLAHLIALQLRSVAFVEQASLLTSGGSLPRVRTHDLLGIRVRVPVGQEMNRLAIVAGLLDDARYELNLLDRRLRDLHDIAAAAAIGNSAVSRPRRPMRGPQQIERTQRQRDLFR